MNLFQYSAIHMICLRGHCNFWLHCISTTLVTIPSSMEGTYVPHFIWHACQVTRQSAVFWRHRSFYFTSRNARSPLFLLLFDIHTWNGWMYGNIAIVSTCLHNIIAFQCTADEYLWTSRCNEMATYAYGMIQWLHKQKSIIDGGCEKSIWAWKCYQRGSLGSLVFEIISSLFNRKNRDILLPLFV